MGQSYKPLIGSENYWYLTSCVGTSCLTDFYYAIDDTVVKGNTYKILDSFHYNRTMLIREDTATRKVYAMPTVNYSAYKDLILYDFSLNVGDVINLYNPNSPAPNDAGLYIVDSITNIQIKIGTHKAFYLSELAGSKQTIWVEGIGALSIITTPSEHPNLQGIGDLSCFYRDGIQVYESDSLANGSCDTSRMSVNVSELTTPYNRILIYPNPFNEYVNIENKYLEDAAYKIINMNGKVIIKGKLTESLKVDLKNYSEGLYLITVFNDEFRINKKLLKINN